MRNPIVLVPWLVLILLLATIAGSWSSGGIAADMIRSDLSSADRVVQLQQFFRQAGVWAPLVYVIFVIMEVLIAPIPGLMLYAPGGMFFGPWYGGILSLIGNVIGSGISCGLIRSAGAPWLNRIAGKASMEPLQAALNKRGIWVIVLLRLNPLTSTDLLSWVAGFTRIPVHHVMLATGIGMAPLCFAQSWLSDSIFHKWPQLLWPLMLLGVLYLVVVAVIVARLLRRSPGAENP